MKGKARGKPAAVLMNHRVVAALMGQRCRTVTVWIEQKVFPPPHSRVGTLYFYRAADVNHFLSTGRWPDAMVREIKG